MPGHCPPSYKDVGHDIGHAGSSPHLEIFDLITSAKSTPAHLPCKVTTVARWTQALEIRMGTSLGVILPIAAWVLSHSLDSCSSPRPLPAVLASAAEPAFPFFTQFSELPFWKINVIDFWLKFLRWHPLGHRIKFQLFSMCLSTGFNPLLDFFATSVTLKK